MTPSLRAVSRTVDTPTEAPVTIKYTGGGGMSMVLDGAGTVIQRTMSLPGGVQLAVNSDSTQVWSYPNLHGDVILTADGAGARTGRFAYDPFGQPIDPLTGAIGTSVADDAVPDNLPGDADHAYVGQHQKLYEHQGSVATIEMGVRQYVPALGRFLSVDPVEGGVTNSYDYPSDPINKLDLSGAVTADGYVRIYEREGKAAADHAWAYHKYIHRVIPTTSAPVAPPILAPRDCTFGNDCKSFDVSLEACVGICLAVAVNAREDGKNFITTGIGIGPRADVQVAIGGGTNVTPGLGIGAGCSAAYGIGYYLEGTLGYSLDIGGGAGGRAHATTPDWSGGGVLGLGGGCSIMSETTVPFGG